MRSIKRVKPDEEKVAEKIANLMKDSTLDLDEVGHYLARIRPNYLHKRLVIIVEAADNETERIYDRANHDPLF